MLLQRSVKWTVQKENNQLYEYAGPNTGPMRDGPYWSGPLGRTV